MVSTTKIAEEKLFDIAQRYGLDPFILKDIMWGKAQGWTQNKIAQTYNYNPNTISRYGRIIEREISSEEIKQLLIIVGLLLGAAYFIKEIFNK